MTEVHLSYAESDRRIADSIGDALARAGIPTANRWEFSPRLDMGWVDERVRVSDVVVLLSPTTGASSWADSEAEFTLSRDLDRRGVELIPVLAAPAEVSKVMRDRAYVDLTADFQSGVRTLVEQIETVSRLDFGTLSPGGFEDLVADLLEALGFRLDQVRRADPGVDLRATYRRTDPFGLPETEVWLVETKLYAHERVSVEAIRRLGGVLSLAPSRTRGLLVTDVQLTSVAEEYLTELGREVNLRILDGVRLRRLLREYPTVAARHFGGGAKVGPDAGS
jgi:Restriction endonuclease/TIR domain